MPNKLKDMKAMLTEVRGKVRTKVDEAKSKIMPESMASGPVRRVIGDMQDRGGILAIIRPMGKTATTAAAPTEPVMSVIRRGVVPVETPLSAQPSIGGRIRGGGEDVTRPLIGGT